MSSVFDNADTQEPESEPENDTGPRRTDDLIREMFADIKVLKRSLSPLIVRVNDQDKRLTKMEHARSRVLGATGFIGVLSAMGFWAWLHQMFSRTPPIIPPGN